MATERSHPLHDLVVAHDERHSYMQRMHSVVGPGAYSIPSTFQRPASNMLLRVVQRENYGREFSRQKRVWTAATRAGDSEASCQLGLVTAADTHRDRRDQLRKLLAPVDHWDEVASKTAAESDSPRRSSSPHASNTEIADIVTDFDEQQPVEVVQEVARVQQQLCFRPPPSYQHFLMSTSYLERLRRLQQRAGSCQ